MSETKFLKPEIYARDGKILQRIKSESIHHYHRSGVTYCPHCNYNTGFTNSSEWYNHMLEIVLQDRMCKPEACIEINACPNCKEISWIHSDLYTLSSVMERRGIPGWEKVDEEANTRQKEGRETWEKCECRRCKNLKEAPDSYFSFSPYISCKQGLSSPVRPICMFVDTENRFGYKNHVIEPSRFDPYKRKVHKAKWEIMEEERAKWTKDQSK